MLPPLVPRNQFAYFNTLQRQQKGGGQERSNCAACQECSERLAYRSFKVIRHLPGSHVRDPGNERVLIADKREVVVVKVASAVSTTQGLNYRSLKVRQYRQFPDFFELHTGTEFTGEQRGGLYSATAAPAGKTSVRHDGLVKQLVQSSLPLPSPSDQGDRA